MKIKDPDHATRAIIEAAKTKLKHGANLARGQSAFWYLAGGGALLAGAGILCGGYSYIVGNKVLARQVAQDVAAALAHTTINVAGEVTVADGGKVALQSPAVVLLDPNSILRVSGQAAPDVPRSSPDLAALPASKAGVVTNFTVFKFVRFGRGEVETGWQFNSSNDTQPSRQYCYYREPASTATLMTSIGENGVMTLPETAPAGVDLRAAFASCIWTASAKPAPAAPSTANLIHAKS
jgi:hypothetical protein